MKNSASKWRPIWALLQAAFAIFGFAACLFGMLYLVTTHPEHFPEPAAGVAEVKKRENQR